MRRTSPPDFVELAPFRKAEETHGVDAIGASFYGADVLRALVLFTLIACQRADPAPEGSATRGPRVVALTPSSTEVVAAVGAEELLVGVDQFSTYPPSVKRLPKVGDFLSPNVEAILGLGCDIAVLDATQVAARDALQAAGIKTISSPMQNFSDVRAALASVGEALGKKPEAERAIARLDAEIAAARAIAEQRLADEKRPRVLVVIDRRPGGFGGMVASGPGTYLDELVRIAGGDNVLSDAPVRYAAISVEEVIARAPDVILEATHTDDPAKLRPDWDQLVTVPAVKNRRVHVLGDATFESPGPRLGEALKKTVTLLWP